MLIDTHLHLVDRSRLSYPWLAQAPALNADWSYEDYAQTAARLGITGALHMEVDVDPADIAGETAWIGEIMDTDNTLMRGAISSARPEDAGFDAFLDALDLTVVKGVRRVLHVMPDDLSRSETFRANVRKLGEQGPAIRYMCTRPPTRHRDRTCRCLRQHRICPRPLRRA